MRDAENLILKKTFDFSIQIISLYKVFKNEHEYDLSKQLLRSATSIGANVEEAIAAHSRRDFVAKMIIAAKEARETRYWLRLLDKTQIVKYEFKSYLDEIESIINILTRIIKTSKENSLILKESII